MTDTVSFPGLGLEFEINRVAFEIGSIQIYWYAVIIASGFCLALLFFFKNIKRFGLDSDRAIDVILATMVCGIIGARLYFVAFQWDYYSQNLIEILNVRGGGLGFYGGIIGGILGMFAACKLRKVPFLPLLDLASGAVLIGQGIGRWGNFVNSECFGCNTDLPWGMTSKNISAYILSHTAEQMGGTVDPTLPVHPTFFYESLWCAIGLVIFVFLMKKRRFDGEMAVFYIGWNGFGRMLIEGLRTDSLMLGNIRISQLVGGLMALAALAFWIYLRLKIKGKNDVGFMKLWADTEKGRLEAEGKWDYKNDAPKEQPSDAETENKTEPEEDNQENTEEKPED